jgi:peptidoglycan DL-endopeptidase CwlO
VWGGAAPGGFDCSGLVMFAFGQAGRQLPRTTHTQWNVGTRVGRNGLVRGDIVFMYGLGHNGIYLGDGQYVHAPKTGDVVRIAPLPAKIDGAVRIA